MRKVLLDVTVFLWFAMAVAHGLTYQDAKPWFLPTTLPVVLIWIVAWPLTLIALVTLLFGGERGRT